ncbi:MAG: hypothetical protein ACK4VI_08500 [Alphaproteobacteria bacterium]
MDKAIYYIAILANLVLMLVVFFLMVETRGSDIYLVALLLLPPVLAIYAIYRGGDIEERRLSKEVRKAKLRLELSKLTQSSNNE